MEALEKEFMLRYGNDPSLHRPSKKQISYLRDKISEFFPERNPVVVINELLGLAKNFNHETQQFISWCKQREFVGFSFPAISVRHSPSGEATKVMVNCPRWKEINGENYLSYIKPNHTAFAFITGQRSNITVLDCDSLDAYEKIVYSFPVLKNTLTVKTRKGFHLYCQYVPGLKSNHQSFISFPNVDIRSDGGLIFSPPTSYSLGDQHYSYHFINETAPIYPMPDALVKDVRGFVSDGPVITLPPRERKVFDVEIAQVKRKDFDTLDKTEVNHLFLCLSRKPTHIYVTSYPVITNGLFEIGFQPQYSAQSVDMYYVKFYHLFCVDFDQVDSYEEIRQRLIPFSDQLTFEVYRTTNGFHAYCVSRSIEFNSCIAFKLATNLGCDDQYIRFSMYNGWKIRLTRKFSEEPFVEKYVGSVGSAPVITDLLTLVKMKDQLRDRANTHDNTDQRLSRDHLKTQIVSQVSDPQFESLFRFISFPTCPPGQTQIANHSETD